MGIGLPKNVLRILLLALLLTSISAWAIFAAPEGAQISQGRTETRSAPAAATVTADGGNVTEINISASTQTTRWQGFFGQVNGTIVLQDNSGDTFYAWNLTNTSGEVYASRDASVDFASINVNNNCSADNILTGFGLSDSANNTFTYNTSKTITVGLITFNETDAIRGCATHTYANSAPQSDSFHEILLADNVLNNTPGNEAGGNSTVYATLIEGDITGYDGGSYDYQLIVPVNVSDGITTYSFYAELG